MERINPYIRQIDGRGVHIRDRNGVDVAEIWANLQLSPLERLRKTERAREAVIESRKQFASMVASHRFDQDIKAGPWWP